MSQSCECVADASPNTTKNLFEQKPEMKVGVVRHKNLLTSHLIPDGNVLLGQKTAGNRTHEREKDPGCRCSPIERHVACLDCAMYDPAKLCLMIIKRLVADCLSLTE